MRGTRSLLKTNRGNISSLRDFKTTAVKLHSSSLTTAVRCSTRTSQTIVITQGALPQATDKPNKVFQAASQLTCRPFTCSNKPSSRISRHLSDPRTVIRKASRSSRRTAAVAQLISMARITVAHKHSQDQRLEQAALLTSHSPSTITKRMRKVR